MATNVGGIFYDVTLDTRNMLDAERKIGRNLSRIGDEGSKLQARFSKIGAAISAALSAIVIEGVTSKIINAQRSFDVMFASLKTMTGGTEQAGQAFNRLREFASQTPYSLEQSVKGFVKLKALGLDPSERAMRSFGNTASAMGKDLSQMIEAVADASTSEFERLKEFGIKAKQEGDRVNLTFQGVTTNIGNNSKEIVEYLTQIGEVEFAGAMAERMKTLDGDISNLQDSLDALYLSISQSGAGDALAAGIRQVSEAIQQATTSIQEGALTEYFDGLKPYIKAAEVVMVLFAGSIAAKAVPAIITFTLLLARALPVIGAATIATRGFGAALALLGGPIGIAVTGLALLALNWDKIAGSARDAATISEQAADRIAAALRKAPQRATSDLQSQLQEVKGEIADIDKELSRTSFPRASDSDLAEIKARRDTLVKVAKDIEGAMGKVYGQGARPANEGGGSLRSRNAPAATGGKTPKGAKDPADSFDSAGYLAGLERTTLEGIALVDAAEQEALRRNAQLLTKRKINAQTAAQAVTLIQRDAEQERTKILKREAEKRSDLEQQAFEEMARIQQAAADSRAQGLRMAQDAAVVNDPVAQLELRLQRESELLMQYASQDLANAQIYAQAKVALEQETAQQIEEIRQRQIAQQAAMNQQAISLAAGLAGDLYGILENSGREQTALGKALFLTQKALAIAQIILNTEVAASKAGAQLGVFGLPMATLIRAQGYASAGIVAGTAVAEVAGGRQYGGPVSSGNLYRVNEPGRPEMFTAANGSQYMLATTDGNVTPANRIGQGGGGQVFQITQHFNFSSPTDPRSQQQVAGAAARGLRAAQRNT